MNYWLQNYFGITISLGYQKWLYLTVQVYVQLVQVECLSIGYVEMFYVTDV